MDKKGIFKTVVGFIGGACAGALVEAAATKLCIPINTREKIVTKVGAFVIGNMVASKASEYIEEEIDNISKTIKSVTDNIKEDHEEIEIEEG